MRSGRTRGILAGLIGLAGALSLCTAGLALTLLSAGPATAGGPTSVLLSSPTNEQTASLYYTDRAYAQLVKAVGPPTGTAPAPGKAPNLATSMDSPRINVTWMVLDTRPERVDQIYPPPRGAPGAVWIHTSSDPDGAGRAYWHEAKDPEGLLALLDRLKILDKQALAKAESPPPTNTPGGTGKADKALPVASGTAEPAREDGVGSAGSDRKTESSAERSGQESEGSVADGLTGWWWAIPGAGAGAALTLSIRQALRGAPGGRERIRWRRDGGDDDERGLPRQELIDN
ncbi:hypothetical protein DSC45_01655 [Streptomyces sp. YIM 130001]|uniref:hypothetical protein n=1 Tax=Streptomyces sp. YIM 130001 TaxID=2259644 RepID=UPI000E65564D|nr:hypothetical protein [Streptomyces sp. YIM 130001]RII21097.1 hypothetical protein DSC45_01655 [Streptomyces sp. YIM 130001]